MAQIFPVHVFFPEQEPLANDNCDPRPGVWNSIPLNTSRWSYALWLCYVLYVHPMLASHGQSVIYVSLRLQPWASRCVRPPSPLPHPPARGLTSGVRKAPCMCARPPHPQPKKRKLDRVIFTLSEVLTGSSLPFFSVSRCFGFRLRFKTFTYIVNGWNLDFIFAHIRSRSHIITHTHTFAHAFLYIYRVFQVLCIVLATILVCFSTSP